MNDIYYIHKTTGIKITHKKLQECLKEERKKIGIRKSYSDFKIYYYIKDVPFSDDWETYSYDNEFTVNELEIILSLLIHNTFEAEENNLLKDKIYNKMRKIQKSNSQT